MRCKICRVNLPFCYFTALASGLLMQLLYSSFAYGQAKTPAVDQLLTATENYYKAYPAEKLYIKTDRPYYAVNDTIWFKAWLFDAATFTPSKLSGKVYIELINDSSILIKRFAIPMKMGLGNGQIALGNQLNQGNYTLRAYTNWMQNFGSNAFFSQYIYVGKPVANSTWLINEQHNITKGNSLNLDVTLSNLNNFPVSYKDVELRLSDGSNTLFKSNYTTGDDGKLHSQMELPISGKQLYLSLTDKVTKNKITMPFYLGGVTQNIDLQFMPEGGSLIAGLTSKVGFKAIGQDGLGVDVQGTVTDSKGKQAGVFKSARHGIGSFVLYPIPGELYIANFSINGIKHTAMLPAPLPEGIVLKVDNISRADSVLVRITASPGMVNNKLYSLIAQSAGGVYLAANFNMQKGYNNMAFAKSNFTTGIVNFTVLDGAQPIAQRKIFIDHHDRLKIILKPSNSAFQPSDSVSLNINVTDATGKPVKGSFALAITDDELIKQDDYRENIISRLLLTSELKSHIEDAAWYFAAADNFSAPALDNLMLTQGWTGFDNRWYEQHVAKPRFWAEPDNSVTGRITGLFKKPSRVSIFAPVKNNVVLIDTITDKNGYFKLRDLPLLDSIVYHIKATSLTGKEVGAQFALDNFTPAKLEIAQDFAIMPWYAQSANSAMPHYYSNSPPESADFDSKDVKGKLLKQVNIKGSKPVDAKLYIPMLRKSLDEKVMVDAGNMNLRDLLAKKFNSLWLSRYYTGSPFEQAKDQIATSYVIGNRALVDVIVDNESMRETYWSQFTQKLQIFLYNVPASEIKNIKIYDGFYPIIRIETRGGTGLNTFPTTGMIVYRPVPYNLPLQFYNPKYKVKSSAQQNLRPTLYWEPNLVTNENGLANIPFFAPVKAGSYTVSIEGADMLGNFGLQTMKIKVEGKTAN